MMEERTLEITKDFIRFSDNKFQVMNSWEESLMLRKSQWICENGGNILEIGFGMGIAANFIQQQDIKTHTICEIHPQIIERLNEWSEDKDNVKVLKGDWYSNVNQMDKYDGILFDTHDDPHYPHFFEEIIDKIAKPKCRITWWNNLYREDNRRFETHKNSEWEKIEVDPPKNTYFNNKFYFMPKYIH